MNTTYQTDRLILKILNLEHLRAVLSFQIRNKELFACYEPARTEEFYTYAHQAAILKCEYKLATKLSTIRFYVFKREDPRTIIGTVCLHDVLRMPYCCCEIGYKFDYAYHHHGYAREAVAKALEIAFDDLNLHRVIARVVPENAPSIRLLESMHFTREGLERGCTQIQGRFADHLRYGLLATDKWRQ